MTGEWGSPLLGRRKKGGETGKGGDWWCWVESTAPTATRHACPQISTQRKVNVYNILQEIIQQEGEMEERCIQRLVAIASKQMRDITEVAGPAFYWGLPSIGPGAGLQLTLAQAVSWD